MPDYWGGKLLKHKAFEIDYFLNTFFTGLWFLTTLFILTVIGALIYHKFKVTPRFYLSWLFVWAILYLLPDVWVLNQLEFLCPFYVMGIAARNLDLHKVKPWVLIVAVVLFSLCLSRYTFDCSMYKMGAECLSLQYLRDTGLRIIGGVSGIVISLFFAKLLTNLSFGQAMLAKVGMLTLPIYVLHQKFLLVNLFLKYTTENLCYCALISVLLTAITISAYKILHRNKYIALFLFGENKKQI